MNGTSYARNRDRKRGLRGPAALACVASLGLASLVPTAAQSAAAAPAAPKPVQTLRVDVDGDGKRDTVTVVRLPAAYDAFRTTVRTAKNRTSSIALDTGPIYGKKPIFAAAPIDGQPGAELILETAPGMRTQWTRMFTWRNGRLVSVNDPATRRPGWYTDCFDGSSVKAYSLRGVRYMERVQMSRSLNSTGAVHSGTRKTFRWKSGGWQLIATKRLSTNRLSSQHCWWHIAGVPRTW